MNKTKEITDIRGKHIINGSIVESVSSTKLLVLHITEDLARGPFRVVRTVDKIIRTSLPFIKELHLSCCLSRATNIIRTPPTALMDCSHFDLC